MEGNMSSTVTSTVPTLFPNLTSSYQYQSGDISWLLTSSTLVFLMGPGVGLFYSGLTKSKSALSVIMLCMAAGAVVSIQWLLFGYSLTFSSNGNFFIGSIDKALYFHIWDEPSPVNSKIPELAFSIYQAMFAIVTPCILIGSGAGRARLLPILIFMILWTTLVYDFIAYWVWNPNGWACKLGSLDFAGGGPVHIASGSAALALAIVLGRSHDIGEHEPEIIQNVIVGTVLIWFGWFGFNGGSALTSGMRAVMAFVVTNMAASSAAITSVILEALSTKQFSPVAFCSGAIIGMVAITPASGFVSPLASLVFGSATAIICHILLKIKHHVPIDDATDVFIVHGIAGLVGSILTGVFAQSNIAALDGTDIRGGWVDGNWMQVPYQLAGSFAAMTWSFIISFIILKIINFIPGLKLRAESSSELDGIDKVDLGITIFPVVSN